MSEHCNHYHSDPEGCGCLTLIAFLIIWSAIGGVRDDIRDLSKDVQQIRQVVTGARHE